MAGKEERRIRRAKTLTGGYPPEVPGNRHHRLEQERGTYLKKWTGRTPVALIYPNTYAVGMSSLGFQLVYALFNERSDVVCERFFLPEKNEVLLSVESGRPLHDFPLLFFSVSFEHDYLNIVRILIDGGVVPYAVQRHQSIITAPLVVCGGVATFMNPEPIAPFIDCFVIGEAEPILDPLTDFLVQRYENTARTELLRAAAQQFAGIYAPGFYTPVYDDAGKYQRMDVAAGLPPRIRRRQMQKCVTAGHSQLLTPAAEFADLYLTELGRGCSRGCRFCAAGFIYRPPRLWDADAIVKALAQRSAETGRVGLLGMEMADDATLDRISSYLMEGGCALSFSSLRADRISDTLLDFLARSNLKSVAIAPDGASQRLRSVINKGLDTADLLCAAKRLVAAGIFKLKLYVMVGLPTETDEDLQEFIDLVRTMKNDIDHIGRERGRLSEIFLSVNCFVPKPWTPFQYHPFAVGERLEMGECRPLREALAVLKEKIAFLRKGIQPLANVHLQADKPENVVFQALLARGDRRLADVLFDMAASKIPWKSSMKSRGLEAEKYILCGTDGETSFPWYIIDHGITHTYLWKEYRKGFRAAVTEPCDTLTCRRCGVCGET